MIFIGNQQVDLGVLNPESPTGGNKYAGKDEIMAKIARKWQELYDKYGRHNQPITFVRPHIKSGNGPGAMGGVYQRTVYVQTSNGTKPVTWCDTALEKSHGVYEFLPKTFAHAADRGLTLTMERDIEQILWHTLFDKIAERQYTYPQTDISGKPHPKAGRTVPGIFILDPDDDAADFLRNGIKSADMWYYLMSDTSPISGNRKIIDMLASAWGVARPEEKNENIVKRMIVEQIEAAEARKEEKYGYKAFSDAVKSILSKDDTLDVETLALVNRAVDRGIVKYLPSRLSWLLVGENGVEIKKLCSVSPSNSDKYKEVLVRHLLNDDDDMTLIQGSVDAKPIEMRAPKKFYFPDPLTPEFFTKSMPFPKMKSLGNLLGWDTFDKKKPQLAAMLIDHFITKGNKLPPENTLEEPEGE